MIDTLYTAFTLMLVGMFTVFCILTMVYLGGKGIIYIGNKFEFTSDGGKEFAKYQEDKNQNNETDMAVISSVVNKITGGRAKNITINKIK